MSRIGNRQTGVETFCKSIPSPARLILLYLMHVTWNRIEGMQREIEGVGRPGKCKRKWERFRSFE